MNPGSQVGERLVVPLSLCMARLPTIAPIPRDDMSRAKEPLTISFHGHANRMWAPPPTCVISHPLLWTCVPSLIWDVGETERWKKRMKRQCGGLAAALRVWWDHLFPHRTQTLLLKANSSNVGSCARNMKPLTATQRHQQCLDLWMQHEAAPVQKKDHILIKTIFTVLLLLFVCRIERTKFLSTLFLAGRLEHL